MAKKNKKSIDKVKFINMDKNVDGFKLADVLMQAFPLVVNFEDYDDMESNKLITFLSGVTYAIDGEIDMIQPKIFLFATKEDYKDGSLRKFVNEYKE